MPANNLTDDQVPIVEVLGIGAYALRRANIKPDETVAIVGCGPIRVGIMKLAQIASSKVIALEMNEQRLKYAKKNRHRFYSEC